MRVNSLVMRPIEKVFRRPPPAIGTPTTCDSGLAIDGQYRRLDSSAKRGTVPRRPASDDCLSAPASASTNWSRRAELLRQARARSRGTELRQGSRSGEYFSVRSLE